MTPNRKHTPLDTNGHATVARSWPVLKTCLDVMGGEWSPSPRMSASNRPFAYQTHGGCVLATDILERFADNGLVQRSFYERTNTCPRCDGCLILFREVCPECESAGLERPEMIHHYTCAGVFDKADFASNGSLVCPKCRLPLQFVGVDHEYLLGPFNCVECRTSSSVVPTAGRCLECDYRFDAEQAGTRDWYEYACLENGHGRGPAPCSIVDVLTAFTRLGDERGLHQHLHLNRMRSYCSHLAHALRRNGYRERGCDLSKEWCDNVAVAAQLHDVGHVALDRDLLLLPGVYSPEQRATVAQHVNFGSTWVEEVIRQFGSTPVLKLGRSIVAYHHERWDGSGYSHGLVQKESPLEARIVAVADLYDAMRRGRAYREGLAHQRAVQGIVSQAGTTLDPDVVQTLATHNFELERVFSTFQPA